ncbi:MAG: Gfo/Idh/MocA family oxidoreductase [Candidatus Latescibacteria bacterium]|nr:Gfo/Idh/MocA family oxidoreductase [Candidatus Latescibacterota bacterium]
MKHIGLAGCGRIGRLHARNLAKRAHLYYCSRSRPSAECFQQEFGGTGVVGAFEDLLALPQLDAVVLASPPQVHAQQVIAALQANKAVLAEKPLCLSPEEVAAIARVVSPGRPFLMVAENYYYKPSLRLCRELIGAGAIGQLRSVEVKKCFGQEAAGWKSQCGALLEGGIHFVALIDALFDATPLSAEAEFPGRQPGLPERHSITRLSYPGDVRATLHYAWNQPSLTRGLFQHSQLRGTQGRIIFESNGLYAWLSAGNRNKLYFPGFADLMGYRAMTEDFLACLEDPARRPSSDFEKAKRDLGVVFRAYEGLQNS